MTSPRHAPWMQAKNNAAPGVSPGAASDGSSLVYCERDQLETMTSTRRLAALVDLGLEEPKPMEVMRSEPTPLLER